jgi:hypothetical protein
MARITSSLTSQTVAYTFSPLEAADQPSRWNTLRALRVLYWAGRGS